MAVASNSATASEPATTSVSQTTPKANNTTNNNPTNATNSNSESSAKGKGKVKGDDWRIDSLESRSKRRRFKRRKSMAPSLHKPGRGRGRGRSRLGKCLKTSLSAESSFFRSHGAGDAESGGDDKTGVLGPPPAGPPPAQIPVAGQPSDKPVARGRRLKRRAKTGSKAKRGWSSSPLASDDGDKAGGSGDGDAESGDGNGRSAKTQGEVGQKVGNKKTKTLILKTVNRKHRLDRQHQQEVAYHNGQWVPEPVDTSAVFIEEELVLLVELLAKNDHEVWAKSKVQSGWRYGREAQVTTMRSPLLVPFEVLSVEEKSFQRRVAIESIKTTLSLGFTVKVRNQQVGKQVQARVRANSSSAEPKSETFIQQQRWLMRDFKHNVLRMCLAKVARAGDSDMVLSLLDLIPEDVDAVDRFNHTALYVAAKRNRQETVKILIRAKANPNVPDVNGLTALMVAACLGNCGVCRS